MKYSDEQLSADASIRAAGRQVVMEYDVITDGDVVTDSPSTVTVLSVDVWIVAFPLRGMMSDSYEAQTEIRNKTRKFLMSARGTTVVPATGMRIREWEGKKWRIGACTPLVPDGTDPIVFTGVMAL